MQITSPDNEPVSHGFDEIFNLISINASISRIGDLLGQKVGVSGPQWAILTILETMNGGCGISVKDVASKMCVDPSFVSSQARTLQAEGLIQRKQSRDDRRIVILSLTDDCRERMKQASKQRYRLHALVHAELGEVLIAELADGISAFEKKMRKVAIIAELNID